MKSFEPGFIERQTISHALLRTVRLIGEYKGKQDLYREQSPQVLETLQQAAAIQSTESSNRIEGVTAGYRDVLGTIHVNYDGMEFTPNLVLQLHRDLFQFTPAPGGSWKQTDNDITEMLPDGTQRVRFRPVPAHLVPEAMRRLHGRFDDLRTSGEVEPLLLIPAYVLDFLCIHPFRDGNGRMARLLTLLLLYKAGYGVGRYISLEMIVEQTRESYYDTLHRSDQGWHEGRHDLVPWWEYFLGVMLLTAYRDFEQRVGVVTTARGAKREMVQDAVARLPRSFKVSDVERACPGTSRPTINRALAELRREGKIRSVKRGRDAVWERVEETH
jgi:Fic family protein